MVNFKTQPQLAKEYVTPKSVYTPSFEKPSVVAGCNKQSTAHPFRCNHGRGFL